MPKRRIEEEEPENACVSAPANRGVFRQIGPAEWIRASNDPRGGGTRPDADRGSRSWRDIPVASAARPSRTQHGLTLRLTPLVAKRLPQPRDAARGTSDGQVRHHAAPMRAVTFQAPGEVRVDERPDPVLESRTDAIVRIEASGICGSDLHIYHGRVKIAPGFHDRPRVRRHGRRGRGRRHPRQARRPRPRLLPLRLRHVLLLPAQHLPQVRPHAGVRPRRAARRSPGHAG